jgi:hypothetical protein
MHGTLNLCRLVLSLLMAEQPAPAANPPASAELGIANVTASSVGSQGNKKTTAVNAIDGDPETAWRPNLLKKGPQWIQLDFGDKVRIDRCTLRLSAPRVEPADLPSELRASLVLANKSHIEVAGFVPAAGQPLEVLVGGKSSRTVRLLVSNGPRQALPDLALAEFSCFGTPRSESSPRERERELARAYEKQHPGRARPQRKVPPNCKVDGVPESFSRAENGAVIVHGESLVEYYASCGSPCGYSVFVDCLSGRVSEPRWIPIAVNPDQETLLNAKGARLRVSGIFDGEDLGTIDRPAFKRAADLSSAVDGLFLPNGALRLWYTDLRDHPVVETMAGR